MTGKASSDNSSSDNTKPEKTVFERQKEVYEKIKKEGGFIDEPSTPSSGDGTKAQ